MRGRGEKRFHQTFSNRFNKTLFSWHFRSESNNIKIAVLNWQKSCFSIFLLQIVKHSVGAMMIKILLDGDPKRIISETMKWFSLWKSQWSLLLSTYKSFFSTELHFSSVKSAYQLFNTSVCHSLPYNLILDKTVFVRSILI